PAVSHTVPFLAPRTLILPIPIMIGSAAGLLAQSAASVPGWARWSVTASFPALLAWLILGGTLNGYAVEPLVALAFLLASALLIVCVSLDDGSLAVGRILSARCLTAVGAVSYGLYLYHVLLVTATPWLAPWQAEAIAVPLAFGSYHLFERRFLVRRETQAATAVKRGAEQLLPASSVG